MSIAKNRRLLPGSKRIKIQDRLRRLSRRHVAWVLGLGGALSLAGSNAIAQTPAAPAPIRTALSDQSDWGQIAYQGVPVANSVATAAGQLPRSMPDISIGQKIDGLTVVETGEVIDKVISQRDGDHFVSAQIPMDGGMGLGMEPYGFDPVVPYAAGGTGLGRRNDFATGPTFNSCEPGYCRQFYISYDALWLRLEKGSNFTMSRTNNLDSYDYNLIGRYTLGQMFDCTDGVEFTYIGPARWERGRQDVSPGGGLISTLTAGGDFPPAFLDTFNGAIAHSQIQEVKMQSFEFNRKWHAWDIMSTLIGVRAIQYDERFGFTSVAPDLGVGTLRLNADNFLLGAQIGGDLARPLSQRLSVGTRSRLGVFANFNEGRLVTTNRNLVLNNTRVRDVDIAGLFEYGIFASYRILPRVVARAGYEAWYVPGLVTVSEQRLNPITQDSGSSFRARGDAFMHGGYAGLEISF